MKEENQGVFLVLLFGVVMVLLGAVLGEWPVRAKVEVDGRPSAPTGTARAVPSATLAMPTATAGMLPAGLEMTEGEVVTYMYRLDEWGERVWREAGVIPAGRLVKVKGCIFSPAGVRSAGYRQVEYQPDLERPGWWNVEWERCEE